jgi:hypothetical protein
MITEQWQFGLLIGLFAVHLLAAGFAYRRGKRGSGDAAPASGSERELVDREAGVVECPACATENELGYRYCRSCVDELPTPMRFGGRRADPMGRIVR